MLKTLVEKYRAILIFPDRSGNFRILLGLNSAEIYQAEKINAHDHKKGG